jgi:hypothetical protein
MKKEDVDLCLEVDDHQVKSLFPVLQSGFFVKILTGYSVRDLLCQQFGIDPEYLTGRIKTIFLDGRPVDDAETAIVTDGATLALSAAMPGLVGATFRRGGPLAGFRSGITYPGAEPGADQHHEGMIRMKLFNLLSSELGPVFLKQGIWIKPADLKDLLKKDAECLQIMSARKDGREIEPGQFGEDNSLNEDRHIFICLKR